MPRRPSPVSIKLTRTPLAGGAATVIEETYGGRAGRILHCEVHQTQSIGDQEATVVLDNTGGKFDAWSSADVLRIEAKSAGNAAYALLAEGYIAEPAQEAGRRPVLTIPVVGLNAVLDLVNITAQEDYAAGTAITDIVDDLAATYLTGYTRTITADATVTAGNVRFLAGTKLRAALNWCRRALIGATAAKWEYIIPKDGATKTFKWYKRASTIQATIRERDLLAGARWMKGSAFDVVNEARIYGATVPSKVTDKTGLALTASHRLDATTKRAAQPFTASDTPLYAVKAKADRSVLQDPPSLEAYVARNSDNRNDFTRSQLLGRSRLRTGANLTNADNLQDDSDSTSAAWAGGLGADTTYHELAAWDFGAGGAVGIFAVRVKAGISTGNPAFTRTLELAYSDDDSSYTVAATFLVAENAVASTVTALGSLQTRRYWRLRGKQDTANTNANEIHDVSLYLYKNESTDASNPSKLQDRVETNPPTQVSSTGNATLELFRTNLRSAQPVMKLVVKHNEGIVSASVVLQWQRSSDGAAWTAVAQLPSVNGEVIDTVLIEEADFQYLRLVLVDARSGGSASITATAKSLEFYIQSAAFSAPLTADKLKGSTVTWGVEGLVQHPAVLEEKTYPAPRVAVVSGRLYWLIFEPKTGASSSSWWDLQYGTETGASDALKSTDSGATWTALASHAVPLHYLAFNNHQLNGSASNSASKTKYANFVPGGVLYGSNTEDGLQTQEMVNREAVALVQARNDTVQRLSVPVNLNTALEPGARVTLHADLRYVLGTSGDFDVVDVRHDLADSKTVLQLSEHDPSGGAAFGLVAAAATQGRA